MGEFRVQVHRRLWIIAISSILSLLVSLSLYASGQKEDPLARAEALIAERKYNEAILIITEVMQKYPDLFDQAQRMILEIQKARVTYNEVYEELIDIYDAGNLERAYEIIKELEDLDRDPNKTTSQSLLSAREAAGFVYNQNRFLGIMAAAEAQNAAGAYNDAITTYLSGFDLSLDIFEGENYGDLVVNQVERERKRIADTASVARKSFTDLQAAEAVLVAAAERRDPDALSRAVAAYADLFLTIHRSRKTISDSSTLMRVLNEAIKAQRGTEKEVYHLSYLTFLSQGRTKAEKPEGIVGSLDSSIALSYENAIAAVGKAFESAYAAGQEAEARGDWDGGRVSYTDAASFAREGAALESLWGSRVYIDKRLSYSTQGSQIISGHLPVLVKYQQAAAAMDQLIFIMRLNATLSNIAGRRETAATEDALALLRTEAQGVRRDYGSGRDAMRNTMSRIDALRSAGYDYQAAGVFGLGVLERAENGTRLALAEEVRIAGGIYSLRIGEAEKRFEAASSVVERGRELIAGIPKEIVSEGVPETVTARYPDRAAESFKTATASLAELSAYIGGVSRSIALEDEPIRAGPEMAAEEKRLADLKTRMDQLRQSIPALISSANDLLFQAERYRQEALDRISEAEFLLRRSEFVRAEERLTLAVQRLDQSLQYREDDVIRALRDVRVPEISREINRLANETIVREVRQLINQGRSAYSQANFLQAQTYFLSAQSKWKTTNPEKNQEIETWIGYVNTALAIESGRAIAQTDPLYSEMMGYLNAARMKYLEGKKILEQGDQQRALALFEEAKQNISLVQQPFPMNKEAGVLYLQILQLSDKRNFDQYFADRYNTAVAKMQRNPQEALIEFQDLRAINPSYPGLSASIYRAEIAAGLRLPPPDPAALSRSRELYNNAYDIVRRNLRAQFPLALEYLEAAIKLNPDNAEAVSLKDRINRDAGGGVTVVLSSAAMEQYRQAENLYLQQRYLEAGIIIDRLLQDPRYARNPQLLELKSSIEARK